MFIHHNKKSLIVGDFEVKPECGLSGIRKPHIQTKQTKLKKYMSMWGKSSFQVSIIACD